MQRAVRQQQKLFRFDADIVALLRHRQGHAEGKFSVVFKYGVGPSRTETFTVRRIGNARHRRAPGLGTSRRVGYEHARPKQLGQNLHVRRFRAACAGAGELEERLVELAALDGELIEARILRRNRLGVIPVCAFMALRVERLHDQRFFLGRADVDAGAAAVAVERRYLHAEFIPFQALADGLFRREISRSRLLFISRYQVRADSGVRANEGAAVALDAVFNDPFRHRRSNASLFIFRRTQGIRTVGILDKFADGNRIAQLSVRRFDDFRNEIGQTAFGLRRIRRQVLPAFRHVDGDEARNAPVHGGLVHGNDGFALCQIRLGNSFFHVADGVFNRQDFRQLEEGSLQNRIGPVAAETDFFGDLRRVNRIETQSLFGNLPLYLIAQMLIQLFGAPAAV